MNNNTFDGDNGDKIDDNLDDDNLDKPDESLPYRRILRVETVKKNENKEALLTIIGGVRMSVGEFYEIKDSNIKLVEEMVQNIEESFANRASDNFDINKKNYINPLTKRKVSLLIYINILEDRIEKLKKVGLNVYNSEQKALFYKKKALELLIQKIINDIKYNEKNINLERHLKTLDGYVSRLEELVDDEKEVFIYKNEIFDIKNILLKNEVNKMIEDINAGFILTKTTKFKEEFREQYIKALKAGIDTIKITEDIPDLLQNAEIINFKKDL